MTIKVRCIELAEIDRFATQWAIYFQVVILVFKVDKTRIATASLAAVTLILGVGGFVL